MNEAKLLIRELRDTIPASQDMAHTLQGDRQERAADTIERLISERDEARAQYQDLYVMAYGKDNRDTWVAEAEQRGYRKGVEDAAKVVEVTTNKFSSERTIRTILALLEQTEPGEKK